MVELFRAIFQPEVLIFLIPLSIIIGHYYLKSQKLRLGIGEGVRPEDIKLLKENIAQNNQLNERVKNLETIITSLDKEILSLKAQDDAAHVRELASKV